MLQSLDLEYFLLCHDIVHRDVVIFMWKAFNQARFIRQADPDGRALSEKLVIVTEAMSKSMAVASGAEGRHDHDVQITDVDHFAFGRLQDAPAVGGEQVPREIGRAHV